MDRREVEKAREEAIKKSHQAAQKFYSVDQPLTQEERVLLANAFSRQGWAIPVGAFGFMALGIMGPRILATQGIIKRKVTDTRMLSAAFGLLGATLGSKFTYTSMQKYNLSMLSDNPNAQKAFEVLGYFPPQIGLAYYTRTSRDSSKVMPDPDSINWRREPPFPINIWQQSQQARPGQNHGARRPNGPGGPSSHGSAGNNDNDQTAEWGPSPTGTSWDAIRAQAESRMSQSRSSDQNQRQSQWQDQNREQSNGTFNSWDIIRQRGSQSSSQTARNQDDDDMFGPPITNPTSSRPIPSSEGPILDQRPTLTPAPPPPALAGPPKLDAETSAFAEDQREFDRELERERQGYGVKDDFSESEKRWT
uniref:ARAD1B24002p n=1 Tax=Blastobotrys adeninivorans TaxID=409370 RepID=A0A060T710_BLAAD